MRLSEPQKWSMRHKWHAAEIVYASVYQNPSSRFYAMYDDMHVALLLRVNPIWRGLYDTMV